MTRRRLLCGLLLASAVLACFAGWLWIASTHWSMLARFHQVEKGMSREEVIRIVGGPPTGTCNTLFVRSDTWACEEGSLMIHFDDAGTAALVTVIPHRPPTLTERIRRWLGL
jgi:hypothetical protein